MIQTRARATFEGVPADRPAVTLRSPLVRFWSLQPSHHRPRTENEPAELRRVSTLVEGLSSGPAGENRPASKRATTANQVAALVVNTSARMAGGQCPLKGGQLTTTAAMGNW
jgi:hypothetical protein